MPELQTLTKTRITGEIFRVRFENPSTGFALVTFQTSDGMKFAAKGLMAADDRIQYQG